MDSVADSVTIEPEAVNTEVEKNTSPRTLSPMTRSRWLPLLTLALLTSLSIQRSKQFKRSRYLAHAIGLVGLQQIQRLTLRRCRNVGRLSLLAAGITGCWLGSGDPLIAWAASNSLEGQPTVAPVIASSTPSLKSSSLVTHRARSSHRPGNLAGDLLNNIPKNSSYQRSSYQRSNPKNSVSSSAVQKAGLEPSSAPLDLEALNLNTLPPLSTRDYQTRSDVSQSDLSAPSLWWRVAEIGDRLLTDWLIYPDDRRVDVVVDPQRWNWMSYLDHYRVMMQLANETQPHGYSVRVFDPQEPTQPLASYTCDRPEPPEQFAGLLEDNTAIETVTNHPKNLVQPVTALETQPKETHDSYRERVDPVLTENTEPQETQAIACDLKITGSNQQAWR